MSSPSIVLPLARELARRLPALGWRLATAESCTGGLLAATLTEVAGASLWFERGWVTYSNVAKHEELGVETTLLAAHGAVSAACARQMALGARQRSGAEIVVAITGIAGPGGGSAEKPVGCVYIAWATAAEVEVQHLQLEGDRATIRWACLDWALRGLLRLSVPH